MFVYITWGLVGILLFLLAKRIGAGVVGVGVFVGAVFLTIFMLDTFTVINVRNFVPVHFYDDTIEDPKGAVNKVGEKLGEAGEKSADKINNIGENANRYFEVEDSKEKGDKTWVKGDEVTDKENASKKLTGDAEEKKEKKGSAKKEEESPKEKKGTISSGSSTFVKYTEIDSLLQTRYKELPHEDTEILKSISPILRTKVEGEKIIVDNRGDRYKEGFTVHMK
ncbi:hypothetical protein CN495_07860 [Bacillus thuringiensis]|uniref:Uncharacterized protein n=1 Tax=Bacillus thuringiensis TaxID=1428 RepID=A0ABD6S753_BACTU|nr:hypothetical protein [Bacillus thuringiensis]PER55659.1 hypothetical protein CN495_07860 [Bacillus thuringiensis]